MKSWMLFSLFLLTLAGCSPDAGKGGVERVSAVVDNIEITRREVDFLSRKPVLAGAEGETERKRVLSLLVRKELLAQKALEMKLENSPDFIVAMYEARRSILAEMAEKHVATQAAKVSPEAASRVVAKNPRFFSQRKLLVYDQVVMPGVDEKFLNSLNTSADRGASLEQLLKKVNEKKMPFYRTMQALTTDQIDLGIFNVLSTLRLNKPQLASIGEKFSMILVLRAKIPMPLEGETANQAAAEILNEQQRRMELLRTLTKSLDSADITFFGEFASGESEASLHKAVLDLPPAQLLQP